MADDRSFFDGIARGFRDVVAEPCFRKRALRLRLGHAYNVRDVDGLLIGVLPLRNGDGDRFSLAELAAIRGLTHDLALGVFVAVATRGDAYREARLLKSALGACLVVAHDVGNLDIFGAGGDPVFDRGALVSLFACCGILLAYRVGIGFGDFVACILRRVSSVFNGLFRLFGRHAAQVGNAALLHAL